MPRINITIGKTIEEKLEAYAKMMGMSKSSLGAFFVAQGVMSFDKASSIATDLAREELRKDK